MEVMTNMETLYIEAASIECSEERREISGKIVPMGTGEIGSTNLGGVTFAEGSIDVTDISKIRLLSQHDSKKVIGKMLSAEVRPNDGIYAVFRLSRSTAGSDALVMAQEGLVNGLSIGAEILASKPSRDGHTVVTAAKLKEVSLVTEPAFKSAQVLEIAAEEVIPAEPTQPESETVVEDTTVEATPVEAAAVEASAPVVKAMHYATPRIDTTPHVFLEQSIRASLGSESARQYLAAASDTDTTDVAGLVPTRQLTEIINNKSTSGRPSIDAISAGTLPDAGFKFQIPRVKAVPTVAETAEKAAFSDTQVEIEYLDVNVKKYAGMQLFDVEVLDRTSPAFFAELQSLMADAYAKATNYAVNSAITAGGTLDATTITLPFDGAEIAGFIARASDSIYTNTLRFAQSVIVSPTQWANIMGMVDSQNRPLFIAAQPQNAAGSVSQSLRGSLLGLELYVDYTMTGEGDNSILVVNRDSYTWYESPRLQLRADKVGTGQVEVGYYGYGAIATKAGAGAFRFNKA
jgi:HK97 family phage prohead protease/HK97 family phage major capsid protein